MILDEDETRVVQEPSKIDDVLGFARFSRTQEINSLEKEKFEKVDAELKDMYNDVQEDKERATMQLQELIDDGRKGIVTS